MRCAALALLVLVALSAWTVADDSVAVADLDDVELAEAAGSNDETDAEVAAADEESTDEASDDLSPATSGAESWLVQTVRPGAFCQSLLGKVCTSDGDPHIRTFFNKHIDVYTPGIWSTLFKSGSTNVQAHLASSALWGGRSVNSQVRVNFRQASNNAARTAVFTNTGAFLGVAGGECRGDWCSFATRQGERIQVQRRRASVSGRTVVFYGIVIQVNNHLANGTGLCYATAKKVHPPTLFHASLGCPAGGPAACRGNRACLTRCSKVFNALWICIAAYNSLGGSTPIHLVNNCVYDRIHGVAAGGAAERAEIQKLCTQRATQLCAPQCTTRRVRVCRRVIVRYRHVCRTLYRTVRRNVCRIVIVRGRRVRQCRMENVRVPYRSCTRTPVYQTRCSWVVQQPNATVCNNCKRSKFTQCVQCFN